jgi:hypothetical protein
MTHHQQPDPDSLLDAHYCSDDTVASSLTRHACLRHATSYCTFHPLGRPRHQRTAWWPLGACCVDKTLILWLTLRDQCQQRLLALLCVWSPMPSEEWASGPVCGLEERRCAWPVERPCSPSAVHLLLESQVTMQVSR